MREADIRPASLLNEYLRLSAQDAQSYFADVSTMVKRACPGCDEDDPVFAFEKNGFDFFHCRSCRTLYANPIPAAGALGEFYRDSPSQKYWGDTFFPAVEEARREQIFRPRVSRIKDILGEFGQDIERITDVGAGTGIVLEECKAAGLGAWHGAIEPNNDLAELCRQKGFTTYPGFANEAAAEPAWRSAADLVTCFEVIEHVANCASFVGELADLAAPGGIVLITGLCGSGYDILTLGAHSKAVSPPHHLNFLSRAGAGALVKRCGLTEIKFLTPGELDVDIVGNTDQDLGRLDLDPFARHLIDCADQETRDEFQKFLSNNALSSHMWIIARKPV
jgi:hypothetical protein